MRIHGLCVLVACLALTAQADPVRLVNVSTRMQVLTGNDVMIAGFVVGGSASKTVAIVATGPSLTQFGIANALANPTLTLVRSSDQARRLAIRVECGGRPGERFRARERA